MKYRPALQVALMIGLLAQFSHTSFAQDSLRFDFFPGKKIFPRLTADALEHTLSLAKNAGNRDWIGTIGAAVPVLQLSGKAYTAQVGLAATTFNGLIKPSGQLTVYTVDYRVDFPVDVRLGALALRAGPGHISCHYADDGIEILGKHSRQVIEDYVAGGASYDIPAVGGFVYGHVDYIYHFVPYGDLHWRLQVGGEVGNFLVAGFIRPYGAIDVKIKEQVGWGTTQNYQLGIRFFIKQNLPLRVAYTFRTGYDERGQFFDQKDEVNMVGVYLDL